ncbi:MAG: methionine synthase [Ruminococcaceae bacterium]|nr:methionine synthase [Oscillospiraceae bacterium]
MTSIVLSPPDRNEILRYMGTPPEQADVGLLSVVDICSAQMLSAIRPRWTYRLSPVRFEDAGIRLDSGLLLPGRSLKTHLAGCDRVVVLCATLGAQADTLIRQAECSDMLRALTLDCCASALVEQLCDRAELYLNTQFPGCHSPFRFSPGYGDLPLEVNTTLLDWLDAPRTIGLCATSSHLLTPRKSVTALLGLSDHPVETHKRSCPGCPAYDGCQYRKSGGHCGIS